MKRIAGWGKLNDEDALTAKVDVLARTQRYKQVCRPERTGSAGGIPRHAAGGNRLAGDQEPRQPHEHARLDASDHPGLLSPTQMAFWLAIFDHTQVAGCASEKKARVRKLWWKMREVPVKPLPPDMIREIVRKYIEAKGILIESPELYISHVVKQSGGVPQAIHDMLDESGKERIIDKRKVREMHHEIGVRYLDFAPMVMIVGALSISMRYGGMGTGDKTLYILGGMGAALFLTFRYFIFKGVGRQSSDTGTASIEYQNGTNHMPLIYTTDVTQIIAFGIGSVEFTCAL